MAVEYIFGQGAPATADRIGMVIAGTAVAHQLVEADPVRFDRPGAFLRSGVLVSSSTPSPLPFPDPVKEQFGFVPSVVVMFRQDHTHDSFSQDHDMVRLVAAALDQVLGDAWLAFAGELTLLVRIRGRLTLDADSDFWTPDLIALLPPHDRAVLPNL